MPGSYSYEACRKFVPEMKPVGQPTFQGVIDAIKSDSGTVGMIPIENSHVGRVPEVYKILPDAEVLIQSEFFLPIRHALLGVSEAALSDVRTVIGHPMALAQCSHMIAKLGCQTEAAGDTSSAAQQVAENGDSTIASIGSKSAAQEHGLSVLQADVQNSKGNTTRFILLSDQTLSHEEPVDKYITTIVFEVRSIPAALFKVLGGFATNSVNLTKLESYYVGEGFRVAKFYCDFEGHPEDLNVSRALEEVRFYSRDVTTLGVYPAASFRLGNE